MNDIRELTIGELDIVSGGNRSENNLLNAAQSPVVRLAQEAAWAAKEAEIVVAVSHFPG